MQWHYSLGCLPLALRGPPVVLKAAKCLLIGRDKGASPLINVLFNSNKVRRTLSNTNPSISNTCEIQEELDIAIASYTFNSYYNEACLYSKIYGIAYRVSEVLQF